MSDLTIRIRGANQASPALREVVGNLRSLQAAARQTGAALAGIGGGGPGPLGGLAGLSRGLGTLRGVAGGALLGVAGLSRGLGSLVGTAANASATLLRGLLGTLSRLGALAGTVALGGVTALAAGLGALARRGVEVNLTLQRAETTFGTLFKSAAAGTRFMAALRREAASSAFEFTELAGFAESLAGFGFREPEIIPILRTLGDVARGDTQRLERLALAIGQIRAKGVLQGDEALQLTEAGIPVREILGIQPGTDFSDAKLSAAEALPRLLQGLQARFGGLQAAATQTLPGRLSNISDALNEISASVTTGLLERLRRAAGQVLEFAGSVQRLPAGRVILTRIGGALDGVGRAAEALAGRLPDVARALAAGLQADGFTRFLGAARQAFATVLSLGQRAAAGVATHWSRAWGRLAQITLFGTSLVQGIMGGLEAGLAAVGVTWQGLWDGFQTAAAGTIRVVGGLVVGLIAAFGEMTRVQANGMTGFQNLGESVKRFAIQASLAFDAVTLSLGMLALTIGTVITAVGALGRNVRLAGLGLAVAAGGAFTMATVPRLGRSLRQGLQNFDPASLGGRFQQMSGGADPVGAFQRGYAAFQAGFDRGFQAPAAGLPSFGSPAGAGSAVVVDPTTQTGQILRNQRVPGPTTIRQFRLPGPGRSGGTGVAVNVPITINALDLRDPQSRAQIRALALQAVDARLDQLFRDGQ